MSGSDGHRDAPRLTFAIFPDSQREAEVEDGCGGASPGQRGGSDSVPVRVLVHRELGGERGEQDHPERLPLPRHRVALPHLLHRPLPPAAAAGMGSPEDRAAQQIFPLVHHSPGFREILCLCFGPLQHMESARLLRTHR